MNKIIQNIPLILIFITFTYSLTHLATINQITEQSFQTVIHLFFSLYPLMVIFSIMSDLNIFNFVSYFISLLFKTVFHLNQQETAIYLASVFSGYPTFAKLIKDNYLQNKITLDSANHLLKFTSHGSIGFIVSTLGAVLFHDIPTAWLLWLIQVISNLIIAFIFRKREIPQESLNPNQSLKLMKVLQSQLKSCAIVFIYIFGFILVFNILSEMLFDHHIIVHGFLEFSQGCLNLTNIDFNLQFLLCSIWIAFSSFSVIFQVTTLLDGLNLDIKGYIMARILQALISGLIALTIILIN